MQKRMPRDHFSTAHLIPRLAQRSARGGVVTVSAQALKFILHMGSTMVLARLLTPTDFGLLAMVAFFTGIIGLFADLGLSAATVQRGEIRHSQVSTLFWLNVAFSLVLMLLAAAAAPLIAWFYGESVLLLVTIAISTTYIWGGLSAQHLALLRRQMRFGALATVEVGGFLVGAVAAISVALMGGGYWALVVLAVGQAFGMAVLAFTFSGWRPGRWLFDADVREMVSFGGNIIGARFMNYLTRNADNLLIGKAWGAAELGIYSRAYALLLMPMQQINGPIAAVAIPALSRLQGEPEAYRRYYLKMVRTVAYVSMPLVVVLAVLADEIVLLILGPQWKEAALIFRIFAIFVFIQNVVATVGWVLQSLGRGARMLKWGMIQAPILIGACLMGLPWGAVGVATAVTVQALLITLPAMQFAYKDSPVSAKDVGLTVARPCGIALTLLVVLGAVYATTSQSDVMLRSGAVICVTVVYAVCVILVYRAVRDDLLSIVRLLRR
jgi:O-antigen/teichoic acid export membrane protein